MVHAVPTVTQQHGEPIMFQAIHHPIETLRKNAARELVKSHGMTEFEAYRTMACVQLKFIHFLKTDAATVARSVAAKHN